MSIIVKNVQLPVTAVTASAALAALQDVGFTDGQLFYVATYGDYFAWHPGQSLTAVAGVVINGPTGQYTRMGIPNPKWQTQTTWSIDESNVSGIASDENTGIDDAHPLLNIDEFIRRMQRLPLIGTIVVRWMSDTTKIHVNLDTLTSGTVPLPGPENDPTIVFQGIPTLLRSGTLTAATDAPWTVTDSALPVSWASSGLVSTASGTRMIRTPALTKHAFIGYENVAKTASTSPTNGYNETPVWFPTGSASASFIAGDSYEVLSLPKFPRVTPADFSSSFGAHVFLTLDMLGEWGGQAEIRNCGFYSSLPFVANLTRPGKFQIHGAVFFQGVQMNAFQGSFSRVLFMGSAILGYFGGDMNTLTNVIGKTGLMSVNHASFPRLGTVYMFDTTSNPVIQITNNSCVSLDALHGSNNTGVLVDVRDSGCSVNSVTTTPLTAFDATTSAAHPISVVGTQYDYTAIPISAAMATHNASFTTN